MEIIELAHQRKAFFRTEDRYRYPRRQAMELRLLWTYDKPLTKSKALQEARNSYKEACKYAQDDDKIPDAWRMITKGLKIDPRFHALYAVKGDINLRQQKWTEAIRNFEDARSMAKLDRKLSAAQADVFYNKQLIESYSQRGHWYYESGFLMEAASDYEQAITLSIQNKRMINIQDNLLNILRQLDKYEAFHFYWYQFISHANEERAAILLTLHAKYKIYLREIVVARRMLLQVLDYDKDNVKAQELLQIVYKTGHTMSAHTVIWCMHGCYEKALLTIDRARECDPYNPVYILLKTIVFRLSGRLMEAVSWLESINKEFYKFRKPSGNMQGSVLGELTIQQIREQLIKQWHLIQYDIAMECMLKGNYKRAYDILNANFNNHYQEFCMLHGDSLLLRDHLHLALAMYLCCREKSDKTLNHHMSVKRIYLIKRIVEILNHLARKAASAKHSKETISISQKILKILNEEEIDVRQLATQRGEALLYKSRGHLQISSPFPNMECRMSAADSLRFTRGWTNTGLYRALYADMPIEQVLDQFAPARHLPQSLKILMQYS